MASTLNRRDIAAALGVSQPTIDAWQREGMPCHKRGARGRSYAFDFDDCRAWLQTRPASKGRDSAELIELAETFVISLDGPLGTESAATLATGFRWTWTDVREALSWGLPFATAGAADDPSSWQIAIPHAMAWCGQVLAMLDRYGVRTEMAQLPSTLRGLRVRAGLPLVTPAGFRPMAELLAEAAVVA